MVSLLLPTLLLAVSTSMAQQCTPPTCSSSSSPNYHFFQTNPSASTSIYLVGLFGIHEAGASALQCGDIRDRGLQNGEAFRFAIDTFRTRYQNVLKDVNIGALVFDSCGRSQRLTQEVFNLEGCRVGYGLSPPVRPNLVIGYVGPDRSGEAVELAPLIGQLDKTMISHAATSTALSDPLLYPTLLRTVPSDSAQVNVILAVLNELNWKYVQVVYSSNAYGTTGFQSLTSAMATAGVCIVNSAAIPESASSTQVDSIIDSLVQNTDTRAVVVFANDNYAQILLQAAQRNQNTKGKLTFIGTNSWGDSAKVISSAEESAWGAVTLALEESTSDVTQFRDYFTSLKPDTVSDNPWFVEFWQKHFECQLPGHTSVFSRECNPDVESLENEEVDTYVPYTIRAVDTFLLGLEEARASQCSGTSSICNSFLNDPDKWSVIHDKIRHLRVNGNLQFNVTTGDAASARHVIYNYRKNGGYTQVRLAYGFKNSLYHST